MVKIGGKPILWHIMKTYAHYGFKDFVLCLGYKGDQIKEYLYNYRVLSNDFTVKIGKPEETIIYNSHPEEDWSITLVDTGDKALKGARLKSIQNYIDSKQLMVTYGDGLADVDINALLRFHNTHGKLATVTGVSPISRFGELQVDGHYVKNFSEKSDKSSGLINGGFFVFDRRIFDYLSADPSCDLEVGPLEALTEEGQLMVYRHEGFWACMDTFRDMEYLNNLWEKGKAGWKVW